MTDEEVLGITRDVWESFTGRTIELADDQVRPDGGDVTVGCVTVTGEWQGNVLLACPAQLARMAASAMFDLPAEQLDDEQVADALGELTNMIGGNVKGHHREAGCLLGGDRRGREGHHLDRRADQPARP